MKKLLAFAAFVYFLLAPLAYHPDNKLVLGWAGERHGAVWDIWAYGKDHLPEGRQFNYPPFHFYVAKLQYAVALPVGGSGFHEWLYTSNDIDATEPNLARYSVASKFVLILFSLGVGWLVYLLAKQAKATESQAQLVAGLWLLNPIVLYSVPLMGQNDVLAIFFFLWGWYVLERSKIGAGIIFGLAASVKTYPLVWLPFLLATNSLLTFKQKIGVFLTGVSVYFLTLAPFISNPVFRKAVLGSDINNRFFIAQIDLGFSEAINVVLILVLLLCFALFLKKKTKGQNIGHQAFVLMTTNLILLGYSHFHPQWFTWMVPFWALWIMTSKIDQFWPKVFISFLTCGAWLVVIFLFQDSSLSYKLLMPINPTLANLPVLREFLESKKMTPGIFNNYAHTWIAGMATLALTQVFLVRDDDKKHTFISLGVPQMRLGRGLKVALTALVSFAVVGFILIVAHLSPAPRASKAPKVAEYVPITEPITTTVTAHYDNFSRIDLYLNNKYIRNKDDFALKMTDAQNATVFERTFSGFNAGFESSVRFDIPVQPHSKGQVYSLTLTPLTTSDDILEAGFTEKGTRESLATMTYYVSPSGFRHTLASAGTSAKDLVSQLPLLYLGLVVLLAFI